MNYLIGFLMSIGMFTIIPCPYKGWKEDARGHMLVCLPFVGIIIGIIWYVLFNITYFLPIYLRAVIVAVTPWFITGFIHIDGFMDVCDAVMSRRDLETRQAILKDSRVGAFAVICIGILLATQIGTILSLFEFRGTSITLGLILIPIASRISAATAVLSMKPINTSQYTNLDKKAKFKIILFIMYAVIIIVPLIVNLPAKVLFSVIITIFVYYICAVYGSKMLGGMNGDISGYALTIAELAGIIGLVL